MLARGRCPELRLLIRLTFTPYPSCYLFIYLPNAVGERISKLEEWFSDLKGKLLSELNTNQTISPQTILGSLAMLPMSLQAEYKKYVMENLSTLAAANSVTVMFVHLSFNFTFIDHGLLEHLIKKFSSDQLKQNMSAYAAEIQLFLDETTVAQLGDYWPGEQEFPPHFEKLLMMIDKDPGKCSLRMVNNLRKRFCRETQLSEVVFVLIGIGKANSFIILFMVPSVLGPRLVESVGGVDDSFYQRECIISISLNQHQLYLSVALRKKEVCISVSTIHFNMQVYGWGTSMEAPPNNFGTAFVSQFLLTHSS